MYSRDEVRRALTWLPLALLPAVVLGCIHDPTDRPQDSGTDSGYDPVDGNPFEGALTYDDARVEALAPGSMPGGVAPCRAPVLVRVTRVVDGDTLHVAGLSEVLNVSVRLIGIDTPEIAHPPTPAECYGDEARIFTEQLFGRSAWLTFDSDCTDSYDRTLAYLYVGSGAGDLWQRQLLRRGFARVYTIGADRTFATQFTQDGQAARDAGLGLWSACY